MISVNIPYLKLVIINVKKLCTIRYRVFIIIATGVERIELPSAVLETDVLPLYDTPINTKNDVYGIRTRECRRERAVC